MRYPQIINLILAIFIFTPNLRAQEVKIQVNPEIKYQTMEGFGAALGYYENWLTAHPNKNDIYEIIFNELSLDILRVRNAYDYDNGMIDRVKEFIAASENTQGRPIPFLSTSWGPPAYLKSNNNRKNGGTLKYITGENGVEFDYTGFADWWNASLDEYEANGVMPAYISIQNEPDFTASWESCILNPFEKVASGDTLAGYNKALEAVHSKISSRPITPKIIGPETVGIGYNSVRNYILQLDTALIDGIAHHLYHGVDEWNPWATGDMTKVGNLYPEIPHYQTEYDRGDWFSLAGLIYKSLNDENVVSYLYWSLIWENNGSGLLGLDNPWSRGSWKNNEGFQRNKDFYSFKQYSTFIHPGWQRVEVSLNSSETAAVAFMSPAQDSISIVVINRSTLSAKDVRFDLAGFNYKQSSMYVTNDDLDYSFEGKLDDPVFNIQAHSINTAFFTSTIKTGNERQDLSIKKVKVYPNPFKDFIQIEGTSESNNWQLFTMDGRQINSGQSNRIDCSYLNSGLYLLKVNGQMNKILKK